MMSYWELIVPVVIAAAIYFYHLVKNVRIGKFYANFPSPPTVPIFGNALDYRTPQALLKMTYKYTQTCGKTYGIRFGPFQRVLFTSDYEWVKFLLSTNKLMDKMMTYDYFKNWLGTGLLISPGNRKWELHRKMLTPSFHNQILENSMSVFESSSNILIRKLKNQQHHQQNLDIAPFVNLCTLDIICESAMGTPVNAQENDESDYVHSVKEICRILVERMINPVKGSFLLYPLTSDYYTERKCLKILHNYTNSVINKHRKELLHKVDSDIEFKKRKTFLDLLLESTMDGLHLSATEIREEVDTFMFAGHDTTSAAISFTLYCLANHQDVQDLVLKEQHQIFGLDKNPTVNYSDLQNMKYLEQVIKESLRLYPPVPMYGRCASRDVEFNGMTIPKGVSILIFVAGIHENPEYYPNPQKFDPSRYENDDSRLPYTFIPFSAGARNCIGRKFAMLEMKHVISKIIQNFKLLPAVPLHKLELSSETVLKSLNGVRIGLEERL